MPTLNFVPLLPTIMKATSDYVDQRTASDSLDDSDESVDELTRAV